MSVEGGNEQVNEQWEKLRLLKTKDGTLWYRTRDGKAVVLDDAAEAERDRQQEEPNTPPKDGYPEFSKRIGTEELPITDPNEIEQKRTNIEMFINNIVGIDTDTRTKLMEELVKAEDDDDLNAVREGIDQLLKDKRQEERRASQVASDKTKKKKDIAPSKVSTNSPKDTLSKEQAKRKKPLDAAIAAAEAAGGGGEKPPEPPQEPPTEQPPAAAEKAPEEAPPQEKHPKQRTINRRNYIGLERKSVKEILGDEIHQQYFAELVHALEPEAGNDIMNRLRTGKATEDDLSFFNYASLEYVKRDRMWTELVAHLTEQDVEDFRRRISSLDNVLAMVGPSDSLATLKNVIRHTVMRSMEDFTHIEHVVHHVQQVRASFLGRRADKKMSRLSEEIGIPKDQFVDLFDFNNKSKEEFAKAKTYAHKQVTARIHARAGAPRRMMDWLTDKTKIPMPGSSAIKAYKLVDEADIASRGLFGRTGKKFNALNSHLDHASTAFTNVLATEGVRDKIVKEAYTQQPHRLGIEAGPVSYAEMKTQAEAIQERDIQNLVKERITQEGPKWETGGRAYQDTVLRDMKKEAVEKTAGGGFYAWLLALIFGTKFNKAASQATGRPVHVH